MEENKGETGAHSYERCTSWCPKNDRCKGLLRISVSSNPVNESILDYHISIWRAGWTDGVENAGVIIYEAGSTEKLGINQMQPLICLIEHFATHIHQQNWMDQMVDKLPFK